jgi:L-iditol 2-dehydrogenase
MAFAATPPHNGTLSTFYTLPSTFCYPLPPQIHLREGALIEPLAVAVHIAKLAAITPGSSVIIFGVGPIGLLCCTVARAFGATTIVAVDILPERLTFAKSYAATHTALIDPQQQTTPETQAHSILTTSSLLPTGASITIDATGSAPCIQTALHCLTRGGTFIQAGLGSPTINNFPIGELAGKELTCKGSFRYGPGDYELAIGLLGSGKVSVKELITHEFQWGEAGRAFENVKARRGVKSVIYGPGVGGGDGGDSGRVVLAGGKQESALLSASL